MDLLKVSGSGEWRNVSCEFLANKAEIGFTNLPYLPWFRERMLVSIFRRRAAQSEACCGA